NDDPYGAWFVRVTPSKLDAELAELMSAEEYEEFCT
ncbi:MAG: glycine cleavage system protein H, partial [Candidatus Hodarchaeota archaeon]